MGQKCCKQSNVIGEDDDDNKYDKSANNMFLETQEEDDQLIAGITDWTWESNKPDISYARELANDEERDYKIPYKLERFLKKMKPLDPSQLTSIPVSKLPTTTTSFLISSLNAIYVGSWAAGKPHGIGRLHYFRQTTDQNKTAYQVWMIYEGGVSQGIPDGKGRQITDNLAFYEGQFKKAIKHGVGKFHAANGIIYEGNFRYDQPEGAGEEKWPNKTEYKGNYKNGKKNGKGRISWTWREKLSKTIRQEKAKEQREQQREMLEDEIGGEEPASAATAVQLTEWYEGQFIDDQQEGFGMYHWADGRVYEGEWKQGVLHGKGKFTWPDGSIYEGEYCNDVKQGQGKFTYVSGAVYVGPWVMGKQHGMGVVTYKGQTYEDEWRMGVRIRPQNDANGSGVQEAKISSLLAEKPNTDPWMLNERREMLLCNPDITQSRLMQREHQAIAQQSLTNAWDSFSLDVKASNRPQNNQATNKYQGAAVFAEKSFKPNKSEIKGQDDNQQNEEDSFIGLFNDGRANNSEQESPMPIRT